MRERLQLGRLVQMTSFLTSTHAKLAGPCRRHLSKYRVSPKRGQVETHLQEVRQRLQLWRVVQAAQRAALGCPGGGGPGRWGPAGGHGGPMRRHIAVQHQQRVAAQLAQVLQRLQSTADPFLWCKEMDAGVPFA